MKVLITGASSGIGEACAEAFAAARYDLLLVARRAKRLEKLSSRLQSRYGIKVHTWELDVRDRARIQEQMESDPAVAQSIDVLINNAGLARGVNALHDGGSEDWDEMIDTNIKGLLWMSRQFIPQMVARGRGHVINMGSVAGRWVYPNGNVYCATKFAVRALTESMRLDLHGTGVRVTEIAPGMVETEFSEVRLQDAGKARKLYEGWKPLSAQDVAETVLWCAQRPPHVNIQELVLFPTAQASVTMVKRG